MDGTVQVLKVMAAEGEKIRWCLIGEPSCDQALGDTIRNGRRGSLSGRLRILGIQGHVAYPDRAENPIHRALPALEALRATRWDEGNAFFPPTSFQIVALKSDAGALNVIPGIMDLAFNFRFSTASTPTGLQQRVERILREHQLRYELHWQESPSLPFLTAESELLEATREAVHELTGLDAQLSTGGGTSDGRFIAPTGAHVAELGPCNASIHKVDEHVAVAALEPLDRIYARIMEKLLSPSSV